MKQQLNYLVMVKRTMLQREGKKYFEEAKELKSGEFIPEKILFKVAGTGNIVAADSVGNDIGNVVAIKGCDTRKPADLISLEHYEARISESISDSELLVYVEESIRDEASKVVSFDEYNDEIERIVLADIMPRSDVEENIAIMKENRFPDEMIRKILNSYRKYDRPYHKVKIAYADPNPGEKKSILARCALNALCRCPVNFVGGKSVGKNVCAETLAQILGMPYGIFTGDNKSCRDDIYGSMKTDNSASQELMFDLALASIEERHGIKDPEVIEKSAQFELLKAKASSVSIVHEILDFAKTIKEGGVFVVNEWNYLNANMVAGWLNPVLDGNQFIEVPGLGRVDISPDCVFILCMNDGYTGTQKQNEATLSRLGVIKFEQPKSIEKILANNFKDEDIDGKFFSELDGFYKHLLVAIRDDARISDVALNIRGFVRAIKTATLIKGFTSLRDQVIEHVICSCSDTEQPILIDLLDEYVSC